MSPAAAPRGSAQLDSCRTDYQLNTIPSSPKFCDGGRANMAKTQNTAKRVQNPTSLNAAHARPPMASAPRARLHMPPTHAPQRASLRRLATPQNPPPDPQPPDRGRRGLSCEPRGHRVCLALPAPRGHRRRAAPDSDTIIDELRQLGLVARRRSASSWVDCSATGSDTRRGELGVRAQRWLLTRSAPVPRSGEDRGSRLRGFEAAAHLHAAVGAQRPRECPLGVARQF